MIFSCKSDKPASILFLTRQLYCEREQISRTADSLWSGISESLDKELPGDMDTFQRHRIISIKNGPILKSFGVYNKLSDSMRKDIDLAEEMDKSLVSQIATISFKIDSVEMLKLNYLSSVGQHSTSGIEFINAYNKAVSSPCNP